MTVEEKWRCFCSCTCQNPLPPLVCSFEAKTKTARSWFLLETSPPGAARSSLRSILRTNSLMAALTLWPSLCSFCLQLFLNSFTWSCSLVRITSTRAEASLAGCASVDSSCLFAPACVSVCVTCRFYGGKAAAQKPCDKAVVSRAFHTEVFSDVLHWLNLALHTIHLLRVQVLNSRAFKINTPILTIRSSKVKVVWSLVYLNIKTINLQSFKSTK